MKRSIRHTVLGSRAGRSLKPAIKGRLYKLGYQLVPVRPDEQEMRVRLLASLGIDLLIDVGANEGQYAADFIAMGFEGEVVSFEPMVEACEALRRRAEGMRGWQVRNVALSDHAGEAVLNISANSVSSSLLQVADTHTQAEPLSLVERQERVVVSTLDQQIGADLRAKRAWLKLDVQGLEAAVLRGGETTLESCFVVQCELSTVTLYEGQTEYLDVLARLDRAGFTIVDVVPGFSDPRTGALLQFDVVAARL